MLDLCLENSFPTYGDHHNFMHLRPQNITVSTINVKGNLNMNNNTISNLDLSNHASDLASFRFNFTDTHDPPLDGEIFCLSDMLLLPNPQTFKISKISRMGHHFDLSDWTSLAIIDIHTSVIYQGTIDNIIDHVDYFEIIVTFGNALGNPGSVLEATLEIRYSSNVGSVEWGNVLNKPFEYPPSAHIHMWNDIEDPPATMPPSAHDHVVADITNFPTTMPPSAHQHVVADITDFPDIPPRTLRMLPYTFGGAFTYPTIPTVVSGNFYIDGVNKYLIISKTDNLGGSHASGLSLMEYSSQISVKVADKQLNRYSLVSLDTNHANYVVLSYDSGLSNIENASLVQTNDYEIQIQYNPIFKLDHLEDVYINTGTLTANQFLEYSSVDIGGVPTTIWNNKTPKAFFNAGWFNDQSDGALVDGAYNFPDSAGGGTFLMNGPTFTVYNSQNITGVITSMLNTNKCGIKNTSGVTKNFLIRGKCVGRSTVSSWVSFGLINSVGAQIRQSRAHGWCINNESLTLNFECVVSMAHNDEVYLAGCIHANFPAYYYLINIFLNVVEI